MDREIVIFIFEFISCSLIIYGISLMFVPAAIVVGGVLLFAFVQSIESYLEERARKKNSREGRLDPDGWL